MGCVVWRREIFSSRPWWSRRKAPDLGSAKGLAAVEDAEGLAAERFDAAQGATYLIRPDQHVCARWRTFDPAKIERALDRATARA